MKKGILVNRKSDDNSYSKQLKMEHADLIAEMQTVENLPTHERLQLARLRRAQQLKVARQKEKEWMKLQRAKGNALPLNGTMATTTHHFRNSGSGVASIGGGGGASNATGGGGGLSRRQHISFENSVVLLEAASRNDMQEVAELLEHGITPDAANEDGLTALHQCCIDNNVDMLRLLLEFGANVDAKDSDKWTPLHAAATCGHLELVRILIDHGANLLAVNTDGNMPYDLCDDENTLDYIEAEMSKRGVTQELIDETRSSTERQMLKDLMDLGRAGGDLEEPDYQGATPLHIAAANGYVRVVEYLLEQHVNVDATDKDLWTPVHAAACWGHLEVLEMLAQCGADLNVKNKDSETPSDICEDPEIRERIEQLKTEQETKRLAEAQRRRVRRSQSNNTRAQSVRRTSLRDKTLTTKKDAVEEARLRLQAQEVFIPPDSTTGDANFAAPPALNGGSGYDAASANMAVHSTTGGTTTNNNNAEKRPSTASLNGVQLLPHTTAAIDDVDASTASSISTNTTTTTMTHSYLSRRPPDGRENDELQMVSYKMAGGEQQQRSALILAEKSAPTSTEAVQIQSSKEAANGKINVQVTVLVDTNSTHHHHNQLQPQTQPMPHHHQHQQHQHQQQQQQQLQLIASSSDASILGYSAATLANLKKQRSLSRTTNTTNVLNNYENGSVLGAATTINHNNNNNNNSSSSNNNNNNTAAAVPIISQPLGGSLMDYSPAARGSGTNAIMSGAAGAASVNKFSGVTGDVVSDSTSSKKCCCLM